MTEHKKCNDPYCIICNPRELLASETDWLKDLVYILRKEKKDLQKTINQINKTVLKIERIIKVGRD